MLSGVRLRALSGLFLADTAVKTAVELREEGLDVHVSGVTAYSTLGFTERSAALDHVPRGRRLSGKR
jgi:predicted aminopeptidase